MASRTETRPQSKAEVLPPNGDDEQEQELVDTGSALATLNKSELEMQMEFAYKRPRSIQKFRQKVEEMACFNEAIALQMNYILPRAGGNINGPSTRFAEIVATSWGNNMAMTRVVGADEEWVRAQGIYFDCETNYRHGREVARRITDSKGRRYNADMIGVTGNAAASIAFRNAVLYGVSKGVWWDLYLKTKEVATGSIESLARQRGEMMEWLKQANVPMVNVFSTLRITGPHDIGSEQLLMLKVMQRDLKSGDKTIEQLFGSPEQGEIEAAMEQLGWNEGMKTTSRVAYRGRSSEHLDYLRQELSKRQSRSAAPSQQQRPPEEKPKQQAEPERETPPVAQQKDEPPAQQQATPATQGAYEF